MLPNRKRERGAAGEPESAAPSSTAVKRTPMTSKASSHASSSLHGPLRPRMVNLASDRSSEKEALALRPPVATQGTPRDVTAVQAVRRPHHTNSTTTRSVADSSQGGITNASPRSSDSAASASSTAARAPLGRGRPQQPLRPPLSRSAMPSTPRRAMLPSGRGRGATGLRSHVDHAITGAISLSTAGAKSGNAASPSDPPPTESERQLWATWREKRERLEREVQSLAQYSHKLTEETQAVQDAIEGMLTEFEDEKQRVEEHHNATVARYQGFMSALRVREEACLSARQRALDRICTSRETVSQLQREQAATQGAIISATDERDGLEQQLASANDAAAERTISLQQLQQEEDRMRDATYGLSGEVKELVLEMERLRKEKHRMDVESMETEVARRELYSLCEELKGSIRVYCRVKGAALPVEPQLPRDDTLCDEASEPQAIGLSKPEDIGTHLSESAEATAVASVEMPPLCRLLSRSGSLESSLSAAVLAVSSIPTTNTEAMVMTTDARHNTPGGGLRSGNSTTRSSVATASIMGDGEADAAADEGTAPVFSFPDQGEGDPLSDANRKAGQGGLPQVRGATPTGTTGSTTTTLAHAVTPLLCTSTAQGGGEEGGHFLTAAAVVGLPYGCGRCITIHQTRSNATSTGLSSFTETFTYDKVFTGEAQQAEVYCDVEPLVRNAVDGYRVCIFAYGQTGSGKTFTMEGDVRGRPELYGVTPRALQTVLQRQAELANEGWSYELSCTFIEIYNDVIRDLFQSGSTRYEAAVQQQQQQAAMTASTTSSAVYHTIKHSGDRTYITNVVERNIRSMGEFLQLYKHAVLQRSTAKTGLNDASSRSHCIFTLHISGTNGTIRQRSDGVLCLVDLAGSERVNDSGVQGKQFKEAVNINRSLLDLGKCIRALRCGAVVPWRNCKLTYLLQNYLGAKGGKMLMIVTVSHAKAHALESLNSLRFAAQVQETYVGTSVKRVTSI